MNNNSKQIRNSTSSFLPRTMEDALRYPPVSSGGVSRIPDSETSDLVDEIMRTNPGFHSALEKIRSVTDKHAATKDQPVAPKHLCEGGRAAPNDQIGTENLKEVPAFSPVVGGNSSASSDYPGKLDPDTPSTLEVVEFGAVPFPSRDETSGSEILNSALRTPTSKDWLSQLNTTICHSAKLGCLNVPARQPILGNWFRQGDLGFIYGPRGLGKTWLALHLARQCAEGGPVGPWTAHQPRPVLYIDGEMPLDDIRQRDTILSQASCNSSSRSVLDCGSPLPLSPHSDFEPSVNDSPNSEFSIPYSQFKGGVFYLQHEALFHDGGKVLNLATPEVQDAILDFCRQNGIQIVFLDNLSSLFSGLKENDADAWEQVLPWLLNLRRNRIAVVFIAHAGRAGTMRGTSRREDAAFWVIQLSEAGNSGDGVSNSQTGAKFVASFVKNRNATGQECPDIEWHFRCSGNSGGGATTITWKTPSPLEMFRRSVEAGLTGASEIAAEMGVSRGQVSKLAKQAERAGWLTKQGREYVLLITQHSVSLTE